MNESFIQLTDEFLIKTLPKVREALVSGEFINETEIDRFRIVCNIIIEEWEHTSGSSNRIHE